MTAIELKSYAKINLTLNVCGLREDGYHELETIMQRTSLCDRIHISWEETNEQGFRIEVKTNKPYLPTDERNLAYKAAMLMIDRYGEKFCGGKIKISIKKTIPVAAGMAGGSGNGAAVLIGLNRLWNLRLTTKQLCSVGESLGADVPFCVLVQNTNYMTAYAKGSGEILQPLRKGMKKYLVMAKPAFGVSTKEVFKAIDNYEITERPDSEVMVKALAEGDYDTVYKNMINVLELYTLSAYEPVQRIKDLLYEKTSAKKVLMSGSGPTVFGVYDTLKDAKAGCEIMRNLRYEAYWASTMWK